MRKSRRALALLTAIMVLTCGVLFTGCGTSEDGNTDDTSSTSVVEENTTNTPVVEENTSSTPVVEENTPSVPVVEEESTTIRVGAMVGPTAMGMVKLMSDSEAGLTANTYEFADLANEASALVPLIAKGELDIAAIPSNLAANIYNNNDGSIEVLAVNVLGVLNLVERGDSINSISDLKGRSIYATGQGAVPEFVIRYILEGNGLNCDTDVNIIWCSDTTEALAYVTEVVDAIAILPQPFVTAAAAKVANTKADNEPALRVVKDLNEEWNALNPDCGIVTGVVVVRREFAEKYPQQVAKFLEEYKTSVDYVNSDIDGASTLVVNYGIVAAEGIAKKALPNCHIVCITGSEMRANVSGFLNVLYGMEPKSVGGQIPDDAFYYVN